MQATPAGELINVSSLSLSLYSYVFLHLYAFSICARLIRAQCVNYMCTLDDTCFLSAFEIVNDRVQNFIILEL